MRKFTWLSLLVLWGIGVAAILGVFGYSVSELIKMLDHPAPQTVGDLIELNKARDSTVVAVIFMGLLASCSGFLYFSKKLSAVKNLILPLAGATFVAAIFLAANAFSVEDYQENYVKAKDTDPGNPIWENSSAVAFKTVGGDLGKIVAVGDGFVAENEGEWCLYETAEAFATRTSEKCVNPSQSLVDFPSADEQTFQVSAGGGRALLLAQGVFFTLPFLLMWAGYPLSSTTRFRTKEQLQRILDARVRAALEIVDDVTAQWGGLASDPLSILDHSALLDASQERTGDFIKALSRASDYRVTLRREVSPKTALEAEKRAQAAKFAWDEALRYSSQIGTSWMTPEEQKTAKTARAALERALDSRTPVPEQVNSAKVAIRYLEKIAAMKMPQPVMVKLNQLQMKEIEA